MDIWSVLDAIPDPEIPVLSLRDLGVVRDITFMEDGTLHLKVTPTYSGCPATAAIHLSLQEHFRRAGYEKIYIETVLAPAWTTDWISQEGRNKLQDYGIAPPVRSEDHPLSGRAALFGIDPHVPCPLCKSEKTEKLSNFGSTACKAQYRCLSCAEPFEYFKCI